MLTNPGLAEDSDHKVDGVKPTLSGANADGNDLTKIVLTFSEAIGTVDNTKITVKKGGTDQTTTGAAIDSTDSTKVEITLMTALLTTDTNITVDLAADAVKDVPGNGIAEVLADVRQHRGQHPADAEQRGHVLRSTARAAASPCSSTRRSPRRRSRPPRRSRRRSPGPRSA